MPSLDPAWRLPAALRPGDAVAVIAPAGPAPAERLNPGLRLLSARYRVLRAPGLLQRQGFLAGDDGRRLAELRWALSDPAVRAVFCARGGYGLARLLPELLAADPQDLRSVSIVGFSDVTVLQCWQAQRRVLSVHGPVLTQLAELPASDQQALFALLEDPAPPPPLTDLYPLSPLVPGQATGRLLGGNLEVLSRLAGGPLAHSLCPGEPVVLLLEEIGEVPYRIDRSLTQLAQAGMLRDVVGVVLGDLVRCEASPQSPQPTPTALEVLRERLTHLLPGAAPLAAGAPLGHGVRNRAVPLGALVTLQVTPHRAALTFHGGAVR